ncbi:MAG TPA: DNA mismatch repair protein MutT [Clostridiales bacterium]|nr:DNA mismatch repair protein MutT [Clostridiales bacterium]
MINVSLMNMCMIEDKEGNVLVQERVNKKWNGVAFPGGKIENKESIYASVIREVKEETGLDISSINFCGIKDWYEEKDDKKFLIFLFKTNIYKGTLIDETYEGKNFWVKKDDLKNLKLAEGFLGDMELFLNNETFEIFWEYDEVKGWKKNLY